MAYTCNIIIDSPADLSAEFCKQNHLHVINFPFVEPESVAKDREPLSGVDDLFVSRSAKEFYGLMRNGASPMTSQPSQAEYNQAFREVSAKGLPVLYIGFDSGISGAYERAQGAYEELRKEYDKKGEKLDMFIADSKLASTPYYMVCYEAVQKRNAGATAEELAKWCADAHHYMYTYFMVDDLSVLARGGRISKATSLVGSALNIKPILTIEMDGHLEAIDKVRGRKKGLRLLAQNYLDMHDPKHNVVGIGDADCAEDATALSAMIAQDNPEILRSTIGPTIGAHVGPDMISCCFWGAYKE